MPVKPETRIEKYGDMTFEVDNIYGHGVENYKPWLIKKLKEVIREDDNVVDIGASVGFFTCIMKGLTKGIVYAFEPDEKSYDLIVRNFNNSPRGSQMVLNGIALGDKKEERLLPILGAHSSFGRHGAKKRLVQVDKLDNFDYRARVVKVASMGSAAAIWRGGKKFFKENGEIVFIDPHFIWMKEIGDSPEKFMKMIFKNYTVYNISDNRPEKDPEYILQHYSTYDPISVDLMLKKC